MTTKTVALREASSAIPMSELGWHAMLLMVMLLLVQAGLYVWMAPRGFDFTDESYYFLNYLYWHDLIGTIPVTFFGAYFELPFRMLGQSVPAIRIVSLLLLFTCSAFFTSKTLGYFSRYAGSTKGTPWAFVVVGMATSLFYFGSPGSTARAPSYNLLTLCSMLVATGLLLRLLEPRTSIANSRLIIFCYGLAIGACGLSKATSGVMLLVFHALFFVVANRDWRVRHLLELLALSIAGVSLNFVMLQYLHPQWLEMLYEDVKLLTTVDPSYDLFNWVNKFRGEVSTVVPIILAWALGIGVTVAVLVRWVVPSHRTALSALVVTLIGGCVLGLIWGPTQWWLPGIGLGVTLLWTVEGLSRKPPRLVRSDLTDFALMALLLALPVAFSFGTNNSLPKHSQMAAVFAITALFLRLLRLAHLGILAAPTLITCLAALCLPTLVAQLRAVTDVNYTDRQLSALGDQTMPVSLDADKNILLVDSQTREDLQSLIRNARAVGLAPGQTILDFTGDGPGLIYALRGRPLGVAWLPGGYPGSQAIAAHIVEKLPLQALQSAWLLSSDNNPRAIRGWQQLLNTHLGPGSHKLVATVYIRARYHWRGDEAESFSVQIWKPRVSQHLGTLGSLSLSDILSTLSFRTENHDH
jgi:hypothetical protein